MQRCSIESCERPFHALSYCRIHYDRSRNGTPMEIPIVRQRKKGETLFRDSKNRKQCVHCLGWFPEDYFKKHHSTADGLDVRCKECETFARIQRTYKVDRDYVESSISAQNGCAICGYSADLFPVWWAVDHDHSCCPDNSSCGSCVRGILCAYCNRGLGQFRESVINLEKAIKYLQDRKMQ